MTFRLAIWTGIGAFTLAAGLPRTAAADAAPVSASRPLATAVTAAVAGERLRSALPPLTAQRADAGEGGEGGETGEGGAIPSQYTLLLDDDATPRYDAKPQIETYIAHVDATYAAALRALRPLQDAILALLESPDDATLAAARSAWLAARRPYLETEAFRFYDGPIDGPAAEGRPAGPEPRLNAWPLNEAAIDYVEGDPRAGLVNALDVPMTVDAVLSRDQVADEADVTTGWHALEFLLWGQDRRADGPGERPATDFVAGTPANDRRREYLAILLHLLHQDLTRVGMAWWPNERGNYADSFRSLPQTEALGRMFAGMATLAGVELAGERLAVALDSGTQEDEQSCFSDSTRQDLVHGLAGIHAVWVAGGEHSLAALVRGRDAALAERVDGLFAAATAAVAAIDDPFDRVLLAPPESDARRDAEAAVAALQALARGLRDAGRALGVLVMVPVA